MHGLDERDLRELTADELQRGCVSPAPSAPASPPRRAHAPGQAAHRSRRDRGGTRGQDLRVDPVSAIRPHAALTPRGRVDARWVVRATEGYTAALPGLRRALAPINSSMIVTEPLTPAAWEQIGWDGGEVLADEAHVYVYLQRTADGRIAGGGTTASSGAPATVAAGRLVDAASGREWGKLEDGGPVWRLLGAVQGGGGGGRAIALAERGGGGGGWEPHRFRRFGFT